MKKAQKELNALIDDLKNKNFKYEEKEEREIDWTAYSLAKTHEIDYFLKFVRKAVDGCGVAIPEKTGPGRPGGDPFDHAKIILMQNYFQVGERQAYGLSILFREKLGLLGNASPSSICRAYSRLDVQEILVRVFEMTNEPIRGEENSFSADGTGLPLSTKQNYANDRDDQSKHAGYDKAAVMISNNFHIATGFVHRNGTANDSPLFEPLMEQTSAHFHDINDVELDAGFISRKNCTLVEATGATPYIYPKVGITLNQGGSPAWKKMLLALLNNPQGWLRAYHARSNNECYFSSHKRRFTRPLLRRIFCRRGTEALCRVIGTNIVMLITAHFEKRVKVKEFEKN